MQKHCVRKNLDLENAFKNGSLDKTVYVELPRCTHREKERKSEVIKFNQSLYGLKDVAKVWSDLLFKKLHEIALNERSAASCVAFLKGPQLS